MMKKLEAMFRDDLDQLGIEILNIFSVQNYGPFDYLNEINPANKSEHDRFMSKFKDGLYAIAMAKQEPLTLYQLANCDDDNNNNNNNRPIRIPKSMRFLIGRAECSASQKGALLVYIPKQYLNHVIKAQKCDRSMRGVELKAALKAHNSFYRKFFERSHKITQKYLDEYFRDKNLREMAMRGNLMDNVPDAVMKAIRDNKISSSCRNFPLGSFQVHREDIELPDGQIKTAILTITTKFNGTNVKHYKKKNFTISETTDNYSIFYNLSTK